MSSITANLHGAVKTISGVYTGTRLGDKLSEIGVNPNPILPFSWLQM